MFLNVRLKTAVSLLCAGVLALLAAVALPAALRGTAEKAPGGKTPRATATGTDATPVEAPILMYHSVCVNAKVHSDYYIPPERLEGDLKYLRDHGYTTVFISEIADYAEGKGSLPEKPIALTFDDGYYNWLTDVLPLLERYDMKATMNVVGAYTQAEETAQNRSPAYSYLTWAEIKTLSASGRVEIGSHTWEMHELGTRRGCKKIKGETAVHYAEALTDDLTRLQNALKEHCDITPVTFAYPYGEISREAAPLLQTLGFRAALTCDGRINKIIRDPACCLSLGRINRAAHYSTAAFMQKYGL